LLLESQDNLPDLASGSFRDSGLAGSAGCRTDPASRAAHAAGVNVNFPPFNGFRYHARAKTADLQAEAARQKRTDLRNNIARDVRTSWQDINQAYERLSVTQQIREQANLALDLAPACYNLGLGSIVEFSQAELGKTEVEIADTDAIPNRLTQIVLAYTIAAPK
jgi:outer membrane protein